VRLEPISQILKDTPRKDSLTDQILKFCASGEFGVREAIAAAKKDEAKVKKVKKRSAQVRERKQGERAHRAA
jgi:hypothetical protein